MALTTQQLEQRPVLAMYPYCWHCRKVKPDARHDWVPKRNEESLFNFCGWTCYLAFHNDPRNRGDEDDTPWENYCQ